MNTHGVGRVKNCFFIFFWVLLGLSLSFSAWAVENHQAVWIDYPALPRVSDPATQKLLAKGEYLAKAGDCIACHTDLKRNQKPFSGGLPFKTPFGVFYSPNITPDPETGIGLWTLKDFERSMIQAKNREGEHHFPVFPYLYFTRLTHEDLEALYVYFMHLPPVHAPNPKNLVPFPFSVRWFQLGWKILFFYPYQSRAWVDHPVKTSELSNQSNHQSKNMPNMSSDELSLWNRGQYLCEGLAHCGMCHTPINLLGGPKRAQYLAGGLVDGYFAPAIHGEALKDVSIHQLIRLFKTGQKVFGSGKVSGPMEEVNHYSLSHLSDRDLHAIAYYIKHVPSPRTASSSSNQDDAESVYDQKCAVCHQNGGAGAPTLKDAKAWDERLKQGVEVVYQNAIRGINSMPARGGCVTCSDETIRQTVQYMLEQVKQSDASSMQKKEEKIIKKDPRLIYQAACDTCHQSGGRDGRLKKSRHTADQSIAVVLSRQYCQYQKDRWSDSEIQSVVVWMLNQQERQKQTIKDYTLWSPS